MKKEYDLKKLKFNKRNPLKSKQVKVPVTVRLDSEIVVWLRKQSDELGLPYQTLMNSLLKQAMHNPGLPTKADVRRIVREELKQKAS